MKNRDTQLIFEAYITEIGMQDDLTYLRESYDQYMNEGKRARAKALARDSAVDQEQTGFKGWWERVAKPWLQSAITKGIGIIMALMLIVAAIMPSDGGGPISPNDDINKYLVAHAKESLSLADKDAKMIVDFVTKYPKYPTDDYA